MLSITALSSRYRILMKLDTADTIPKTAMLKLLPVPVPALLVVYFLLIVAPTLLQLTKLKLKQLKERERRRVEKLV